MEELASKKLNIARSLHGPLFAEADVFLWDLKAKEYLCKWKEGAALMQLPGMESPYQGRHGGASRDLMTRSRTPAEVVLRGFWANLTSMRTYHKPGRIAQLLKNADQRVLTYGERIRDGFASSVRAGRFLAPPRVTRRGPGASAVNMVELVKEHGFSN